MKIIVFGCNGMAGHMISTYLSEQGYEVKGFARSKSVMVDTIVGDAMDESFVRNSIESNGFDIIINCIGILNQNAEEYKYEASYLNGVFPHYLAKVTKKMKTKIIHISTDCVFSGKRGHYEENDFKDGDTFYDRTKAIGELNDNKNITFRQSIIGPDINEQGIGLLNWFMKQKGKVNGYSKAIWTGQTTLQLAKTIEAAMKEDVTGVFNMVPNHSISKYELLLLFNEYFKNNEIQVESSDEVVLDKSLKRTNYSFAYEIPDYEKMISELADWMKTHSHLYPHYY